MAYSAEDKERMKAFSRFLIRKQKQWRANPELDSVTNKDFAQWCGVPNSSMNAWLKGSRPISAENALILTKTLGPEVLQVLGFRLELPKEDGKEGEGKPYDEHLQEVIHKWPGLQDRTIRSIMKLVNKGGTTNDENDGGHREPHTEATP